MTQCAGHMSSMSKHGQAGDDVIVVQGRSGKESQRSCLVSQQIPPDLEPLLSKPFTEEQRSLIFTKVGVYSANHIQPPQRPKALVVFGPPSVGKSTLSMEVAKRIFDTPGNVVCVDGNDVRDAHEGFQKVAQHGLQHNLIHTDAWEILKATKTVENLKKDIFALGVKNRQNLIIPECALKPERVYKMLEQMEKADYEMHAICLWAPLEAAQQRGRVRSLKAGKAYSPKFHGPSCDGAVDCAWHWHKKIQEGSRAYCSLRCYDNTVRPSHPVHLEEFERLTKMSKEEAEAHSRNCMLTRSARGGGVRFSQIRSATSRLRGTLHLSAESLAQMLQASLVRGRWQGAISMLVIVAGCLCASQRTRLWLAG